jgi:putative spermidine/putrescine transport system substrate-binding protein
MQASSRMRGIGLALVIVLAFGAWTGEAAGQAKELVVAAWGGKFKEGWDQSLIPKFEKQYGAKIVWTPGNSSATLAKLLAQKDSPQIDVAMFDDGPHAQAVALGLVEQLDLTKIPNHKDLFELAYEPNNYGIGFAASGTGLYYNTKAFADNKWPIPTSWLDLFRPELKGKVAIQTLRSGNGLNLLLIINRIAGGNEANTDPGFARLKELVPNLFAISQSGVETAPLIQQGVVVIGTLAVDDSSTLTSKGVPIKFIWPKEGMYGFKEIATVMKGRPRERQELAHKFIDMLLSKEEQENSARYVGFGPMSKKAELPPDVASTVLYGAENVQRLFVPDWKVVNANRPAWTERWNKEIERR